MAQNHTTAEDPEGDIVVDEEKAIAREPVEETQLWTPGHPTLMPMVRLHRQIAIAYRNCQAMTAELNRSVVRINTETQPPQSFTSDQLATLRDYNTFASTAQQLYSCLEDMQNLSIAPSQMMAVVEEHHAVKDYVGNDRQQIRDKALRQKFSLMARDFMAEHRESVIDTRARRQTMAESHRPTGDSNRENRPIVSTIDSQAAGGRLQRNPSQESNMSMDEIASNDEVNEEQKAPSNDLDSSLHRNDYMSPEQLWRATDGNPELRRHCQEIAGNAPLEWRVFEAIREDYDNQVASVSPQQQGPASHGHHSHHLNLGHVPLRRGGRGRGLGRQQPPSQQPPSQQPPSQQPAQNQPVIIDLCSDSGSQEQQSQSSQNNDTQQQPSVPLSSPPRHPDYVDMYEYDDNDNRPADRQWWESTDSDRENDLDFHRRPEPNQQPSRAQPQQRTNTAIVQIRTIAMDEWTDICPICQETWAQLSVPEVPIMAEDWAMVRVKDLGTTIPVFIEQAFTFDACEHRFHLSCMQPWIAANPSPTCPQCRAQLSTQCKQQIQQATVQYSIEYDNREACVKARALKQEQRENTRAQQNDNTNSMELEVEEKQAPSDTPGLIIRAYAAIQRSPPANTIERRAYNLFSSYLNQLNQRLIQWNPTSDDTINALEARIKHAKNIGAFPSQHRMPSREHIVKCVKRLGMNDHRRYGQEISIFDPTFQFLIYTPPPFEMRWPPYDRETTFASSWVNFCRNHRINLQNSPRFRRNTFERIYDTTGSQRSAERVINEDREFERLYQIRDTHGNVTGAQYLPYRPRNPTEWLSCTQQRDAFEMIKWREAGCPEWSRWVTIRTTYGKVEPDNDGVLTRLLPFNYRHSNRRRGRGNTSSSRRGRRGGSYSNRHHGNNNNRHHGNNNNRHHGNNNNRHHGNNNNRRDSSLSLDVNPPIIGANNGQ